ncbi:GNAT family N-acetyltransferase [Superficieibacter electus]|uniref:GNAT family N-acetyltransferase n=1 Tax=Superficieibacter electus TaxID=2022662 RepID=A0A2P5GKS5_9ENTR|nr:GNAT family N-acetyltransferase [Superficieibacter electus]POP44044.1 GNAT family N-acetyltransferase [Superficieibacter electus]POP45374.1 GNAT family N-acetyltransferase [Superficieibacter electus]
MIMLRPMHEDEYPAFLEYFIADYSREIASNYRLSDNDALARAQQEIADDLPDGVNTPCHVLLCLIVQEDNKTRHVGYLWYKPDTARRTVFIYDFHIFNTCQGQGLGKQALRAFEQDLRNKHFEHIRLRVAFDNPRARHVYETVGFGVTGINMSKSLIN